MPQVLNESLPGFSTSLEISTYFFFRFRFKLLALGCSCLLWFTA